MSAKNRIPQRRATRLKDYDYSRNGAYFVTICTHQRTSLFGKIANSAMDLNSYGQIVESTWDGLANHYLNIELDAFIVMPNHVHGIIVILDVVADAGMGCEPSAMQKRHGLPEIVRAFKTFSARRINALRNTSGVPVWQRSYHDRIIRDEISLNKLREYIMYNPVLWEKDVYHMTE